MKKKPASPLGHLFKSFRVRCPEATLMQLWGWLCAVESEIESGETAAEIYSEDFDTAEDAANCLEGDMFDLAESIRKHGGIPPAVENSPRYSPKASPRKAGFFHWVTGRNPKDRSENFVYQSVYRQSCLHFCLLLSYRKPYFLMDLRSRGNKTWLELFLAGIRDENAETWLW